MKNYYTLCCALLLLGTTIKAQEIYVVNSVNELKIIDISDFSVTDLFSIPVQETGIISDIAFAPNGTLYGVTDTKIIIEIDLVNETYSEVTQLFLGDIYTSLVCDANNNLYTSRYLAQELYTYNIDSGETTFISENISSPGDYTFYKGNLVYPAFFSEAIEAFDGSSISTVGCTVPLLWTFVNVFDDCENDVVYGIDQLSNVYRYDLETDSSEFVADLFSVAGQIYGGATRNEYMASSCPVATLETVTCEVLSANDFNPYQITLYPNPTSDSVRIHSKKGLTDGTFQLWNMEGKLLKNGELRTPEISLQELSKGIYFIQLRDSNGMQVLVRKIIKE